MQCVSFIFPGKIQKYFYTVIRFLDHLVLSSPVCTAFPVVNLFLQTFLESPIVYHKQLAERTRCNVPVDVTFVMDSSTSDTNYKKEKDFVKLLVKSFDISPEHSRGAIVLNSDPASVKLRFNQHTNTAAFKSAIDELPYEKGPKRIDKALEVAHKEVFVSARAGVPKIAIVLTDGWQRQDPDDKSLEEISERLRRAGVRILAVGIGNVDPAKLHLMTSTHNDVFLAKDFDEMKLQVGNLTENACRVTGELYHFYVHAVFQTIILVIPQNRRSLDFLNTIHLAAKTNQNQIMLIYCWNGSISQLALCIRLQLPKVT